MTQAQPAISVIICAYTEQRYDDLVAAVESVRQQTLLPSEIIVVVDHNPRLLQLVQACIPDVMAIESTEKQGLSGARNSGVASARGHFIVFLDDDAVATPGWLMSLVDTFSEAEVLGVGGAVVPLWNEKPPSWFPEEFYWVVGCSYRGMPETVSTIRNPIGANMSFRRVVFDVAGGFRTEIGRVGTLPLGCEETELCIRATQRLPQGSFKYQPQSRVLHRVPSARTSWYYFFSRCYAEGASKAFVSRFVGVQDGLASESSYTFRTLPRGIARGIGDALLHRDFSGVQRAAAILSGLAVTTAGYVAGSILWQVSRPRKDKFSRHGTN